MGRSVCVLVLLLVILAAPGFAGLAAWTVSGVFDDGGTFSGCFGWDVDTSTFGPGCSLISPTADWYFVSTPGTTANGFGGPFPIPLTFESIGGGSVGLYSTTPVFSVIFSDDAIYLGDPYLVQLKLTTLEPLTSAGGTLALDTCSSCTDESMGASMIRFLISGSVTGPAVPEPGTLVLVMAGLVLGVRSRLRPRVLTGMNNH